MVASDDVFQNGFALFGAKDTRGKFPKNLLVWTLGCPRVRPVGLQFMEVATGSFVHRNQVLAHGAGGEVLPKTAKRACSIPVGADGLVLKQLFDLLGI